MDIKEAQQKIDEIINHYGGYWEPLSMLARVSEEIGELSRAVNIKFGGKKSKFEGDGNEIAEEIADVIFTSLALANTLKLDVSTELENKITKDWVKCKGVYDEKKEEEI